MVKGARVNFDGCDREFWVRFPAPAVVSDLVVVCHSS